MGIKIKSVIGKRCANCDYCEPIQNEKMDSGVCLGNPPMLMNNRKPMLGEDGRPTGVMIDHWMCVSPEVKLARPACHLWKEKPVVLPDLKIPKKKDK